MQRRIVAILVILSLILLVTVSVWYFTNIFVYLTISIILATILRPLTYQISRFAIAGLKIPVTVAILISFVIVIAFLSLFVVLFIPLISEQVQVLSGIDISKALDSLVTPIKYLEDLLISNNLSARPPGFMVDATKESVFDFISRINLTSVLNQLISFTGNIFIGVLAVTFITFFLLYESGIFKRQIISLVPNQYFEVFIAAINKIEKLLSNYLVGILLQMLAIFSIASIGLTIVGVNYALTIALFAATANLIPYLGPLLGSTFGILVAVSTSGHFTFDNDLLIIVAKVFSVFAVVQATDNILLQPLIFSKSVKAHPLEIFVIIFVGATVAGIAGMIAAIPVYTVLRVTASEVYIGFNQYQVFKIKN